MKIIIWDFHEIYQDIWNTKGPEIWNLHEINLKYEIC